jgi:hypothetical protein
MSRHINLLAGVLIAVCVASPSKADSLIGNSISAEYRLPDTGTVYPFATTSPNPFIVGAGVETVIDVEGVTFLNIDFSADSLLISLATTLGNPTWTNFAQNGPSFVLSGNPFPTINSVEVTEGGTSVAQPAVSAFLSGGVLFVDWGGWNYHDGDTVTVSFAPVSAVPLPGALPLFGGGLAALAWLGARKRRRAAA